jgi:peptidoglycan/xylan/chitin deacetylase (PgdA/CDA1 family)
MVKQYFFTILYFLGLTKFAAWLNREQVMILCYHCVTPRPDLISSDPWKMFLDADSFDSQLEYLQKKYNVISLQEYIEARRENRKLPPYSVVLTFDDGKRNFLTVIAPYLTKRNLSATTFVVVNNTDKAFFVNGSANPYGWKPEDDHNDLSWQDLNRLVKEQKIAVGSHSFTHPNLSEISFEEAAYELKTSHQNIVANVNHKDVAVAYPHGQTSEDVMKIAQDVGYSCGLTNTDAGNDFETNLFKLNRTVINSDDNLHLFAARVAGITWQWNKIKNYLRPLKNNNKLSEEERLKLSQDFIKNIIF